MRLGSVPPVLAVGALPLLVGAGLLYIVLMSFFVSTVCGYMAGLIGSSNSPLSGIGIIVVIARFQPGDSYVLAKPPALALSAPQLMLSETPETEADRPGHR